MVEIEIIIKTLIPNCKHVSFHEIRDAGCWKNYKILADGKALKISECESEKQAIFVQEASDLFLKHNLPFPKILKRYKKWLLQEFVEGAFLEGKKLSTKLVKELAEALGKMHSIPLASINLEYERPSNESKLKMVLRKLDQLRKNKAILKEDAKQLEIFLKENKPKVCSLVLTQRDFSKGNILLKKGALHRIIDYEDTCIEIKEYDIARTLYSLKLSKTQEKNFLQKYDKYSSSESFRENKKYWMTAIAINKLVNKLEREPKRLEEIKKRMEKEIP